MGEFWETLSKSRLYQGKGKLETRSYTYKTSGAIYTGTWRGGLREGHGLIVWPDGAQYEGDWVDNRAQGFGKFIHAIGDVYEGYWRRDKAYG